MKAYIFPIFIILAGIIISGSIFASKNIKNNEAGENEIQNQIIEIAPVSEKDHILGNPNAKIIIVEYSDFECPYCKDFHLTMNRLMDEYGKKGQVAWVYRHFPLEKIHKKSRYASIVSECVVKITQNKSNFWDFINKVFGDSPNSLSVEILNNLAYTYNIKEEELSSCVQNPEINSKISENIAEGMKIYENDPNFGTPYNFIITQSGKQIVVSGSQPYNILKEIIDEELKLY